MRRWFVRWFIAAFVAGSLVGPAPAQSPPYLLDPCGFPVYPDADGNYTIYFARQGDEPGEVVVGDPNAEFDRYCIYTPDVQVYTMGGGANVTADQVLIKVEGTGTVVFGDRAPNGDPVFYPSPSDGHGAYVQNFADKVTLYGSNIHDAFLNYGGLTATVFGNGGNDELDGYTGPGALTLHGGPGADTIYSEGVHGPTFLFGDDGLDSIVSNVAPVEGATLRAATAAPLTVTHQNGGRAADRLTARTDRAYLTGSAGNDVLLAIPSKYVSLNGGYGNDTIRSKSWRGIVRGGPGRDLCQVRRAVTTYSCEIIRRWPA